MRIHRVAFLGGNGHCSARLAPAQAALAIAARTAERSRSQRHISPFQTNPFAGSFTLHDIPYPGFEGRPRAATLPAFLDAVEEALDEIPPTAIYATGLGGMVLLCLRARGRFTDVPAIMQAPVLWGAPRRLLPRLLRATHAASLVPVLMRFPWVQTLIRGRFFMERPGPVMQTAFFTGYRRCSAFADWFDWLNPALFRALEHEFFLHRERLEGIRFWWGSRDRILTPKELALAEAALHREWPLRLFAHWGHYPMIDDPDDWIAALSHALEEIERPEGAQ